MSKLSYMLQNHNFIRCRNAKFWRNINRCSLLHRELLSAKGAGRYWSCSNLLMAAENIWPRSDPEMAIRSCIVPHRWQVSSHIHSHKQAGRSIRARERVRWVDVLSEFGRDKWLLSNRSVVFLSLWDYHYQLGLLFELEFHPNPNHILPNYTLEI